LTRWFFTFVYSLGYLVPGLSLIGIICKGDEDTNTIEFDEDDPEIDDDDI